MGWLPKNTRIRPDIYNSSIFLAILFARAIIVSIGGPPVDSGNKEASATKRPSISVSSPGALTNPPILAVPPGCAPLGFVETMLDGLTPA
ncbi:MAG: hypothetical protein C00003105_01291 [ANME-2 cluster archaeon HR1]|nr:MAG: hypothetical protein C00003105_01291 [ANME-2 cluster archaeon HR1]